MVIHAIFKNTATHNRVVYLELDGKEEEKWFLKTLEEHFGKDIFLSIAGNHIMESLEDGECPST